MSRSWRKLRVTDHRGQEAVPRLSKWTFSYEYEVLTIIVAVN